MENLNEPRNIIGMGEILLDDEDVDIDELEKSIINGISIKKASDKSVDIAKEYDQELEQLSRQFNLNGSFSRAPELTDDMDFTISSKAVDKPSSFSITEENENDDNNGADDTDNNATSVNTSDQPHSFSLHPSWSANKPLDSQLNQMTNEERKQRHINQVLGNMEKTDDDVGFIKEEEEEDEMAKILEQIDLLKSNLESEGVDLNRIPEISTSSSRKEAKAVLRILQIKNDRLRYCDMFEEGILAVAYGLESMFDGKKVWFGSQIDLTGLPESVKVKLRRMRYDTSTFVSEVVKGYNIGSGWRILAEILPSLFLYSRDRRLRSSDNLISDDKYRDAIRDLNH